MRTRFLNTDYFASRSASETLSFLNLPVPDLLSSGLVGPNEDKLLQFSSLDTLPLEIERLPIESALAKFLSDVIPYHVDVEYRDIEIKSSSNGHCYSDERTSSTFSESRFSKNEVDVLSEEKVETPRNFESEANAERTAANNKEKRSFEVIQFETQELDLAVGDAFFSGKEKIKILSKATEIGIELDDMAKPVVLLQNQDEIQREIYWVDYVSSDYSTEQNMSEEDIFFQNQMHLQDNRFPLLEVDEISLSVLISLSVGNELLSFLENIEPQRRNGEDNLLTNGKEILGSVDYDLLVFLSDGCHSKNCLDSEVASLGTFAETGIINMLETSHDDGRFGYHQGNLDVDYYFSIIPVTFEEVQILDVEISEIFEVFLFLQNASEPETCDWMFREEMNFKNFSELVVCPELALTDDTFKSLPTPILCDLEKIRSLKFIIEEILLELKPQPVSASDEIYLDWHLLEEDKHSHKVPSFHYIFNELESYKIDFDWESLDERKLVLDFIFSSDTFGVPSMERDKESLDEISMLDDHLIGVTPGELLDNKCPKPGNQEHPGEINAERASLLFESMSALDDLAFFLNPQKPVIEEDTESEFEASHAIAYPEIPFSDSKASWTSSGVQLKRLDIVFHSVGLSDNMVALIGDFEKSYLAILQNETELISVLSSDKLQLLRIPKEKLMDCIRKANARRKNLAGDENVRALVLLLAIKRMSWYMCFYGIHVTHLYLDKLYQSLDTIKLRLGALYLSVGIAQRDVDSDITKSHPSLPVIQGILQSNTTQSNFKALILAEQVFWSSLKMLLTSMGLSCNELNRNQPDTSRATGLTMVEMDSLLIADCLLLSHEQVSASFPLELFSLILEYGGSYGTSRISSPLPKSATLPRIHFIKVEMDNSSACGALCEGAVIPWNIKMTRDTESNLKVPDKIMEDVWLEDLLNFVPLENKCDMRCFGAAEVIEVPSSPLKSGLETELLQHCIVSTPNAVIIVNTQNVDKEMIVCRRSTYQKILEMEKEGVQIVERDSDIPVDLMLSSAICLLWYDCENIGKKTAVIYAASSSLPLCIENIATNVLTLLSFTFSCCILIFEGDSSFLCAVMESSSELYAAAASLGIDLQLFCSYSADLTDEIILRCIKYSIALTRAIYPKMLESETLAESFLTKFPSVNPLTAHAILSSGHMLNEFLKLSHDCRMRKMQKYYVPDESLDLFSAVCKYGEREDSKSVMTESSSSVSSGPDSNICHFNVNSAEKKQKYIGVSQKVDIDMDELLHFQPLKAFTDGNLKPSAVFHFQPYDTWPSTDPEVFDDNRKRSKPGSYLNNICGQKHKLDFATEKNLSRVSGKHDSQIFEETQIPNGTEKWNIPLIDEPFCQKQGYKFSMMDNLNWQDIGNSENLGKYFRGEVINIANTPDFSSASKFTYFPSLVSNMENDSVRKPKIARRLSFGRPSQPTFPTSAEINSSSDTLISEKDPRQLFHRNEGQLASDENNERLHLKSQRTLLEEVLTRRSACSKELPFKEEISHCSGTPLSNAIRSSNSQQGSPWTIEFLNGIRERSRVRQQARPSYVPASSLVTPGNVTKATKRKSPSILEFFKPAKIPGQKKQKQFGESSGSFKSEKNLIPLMSRTPIDKRAKQTLSFAMNGSGSQTKLVWN